MGNSQNYILQKFSIETFTMTYFEVQLQWYNNCVRLQILTKMHVTENVLNKKCISLH